MAQIPGSVRVAGFIAPTDSNDTYPVTDSIYGKGGYREVADITARDAITSSPSGDWKQVTSLEYNHITGELRVSYNNI